MLSQLSRFVCLWLCSEVVMSHLHWHKTKTTLNFQSESTTTDKNAHSQRWRTMSWDDDRGLRPGSALAWLDIRNPKSSALLGRPMSGRSGRQSDTQTGAELGPSGSTVQVLHTESKVNELRKGAFKQAQDGAECRRRRSRRKRRHTRGSKSDTERQSEPQRYARESLPEAMGQGQDSGPPIIFNTSDYGNEYSLPDVTDSTPFVSENKRTRRKMINPFYPFTSESYGALTVMFIAAVMFTVGIIGNLSVMCIVCHNYYMRSISNSLLANLALWDFVIIFFCLPLVVFHELTKNWLLGEFSCKIIPYLEVRGRTLVCV